MPKRFIPSSNVVCPNCDTPFKSPLVQQLRKCPKCNLPYLDLDWYMRRFLYKFLVVDELLPRDELESKMIEFFSNVCRTPDEVDKFTVIIKERGQEHLDYLIQSYESTIQRATNILKEREEKDIIDPTKDATVRIQKKNKGRCEKELHQIKRVFENDEFRSVIEVMETAAKKAVAYPDFKNKPKVTDGKTLENLGIFRRKITDKRC